MRSSASDISATGRLPRAIAWLALLLVLLWSSGTARALHERFEHHHAADASAGSAAAVDLDDDLPAPAGATSSTPTHHHHGACETCALLAAMAAVLFVYVQFLIESGATPPFLRSARRAPRLAAFLPATPTTGPPLLAC